MAGWIHLEATKQHGNRQEKSWDDDGAKYTDAGFMIEEVPQLPWAASMRYVLCCAVLCFPHLWGRLQTMRTKGTKSKERAQSYGHLRSGLTARTLVSRFTAPSTLATVISKVPSYEALQLAGGLASGAMAVVTP